MKRWIAMAACAAALPSGAATTGFDCLIEPWQVVEIRSSVDGVIAKVSVQRGEVVRKGQTLVELNSGAERLAVESARYRSRMEGQISSAKNRIDYATKKLARAAELAQQNYGSAQARDEADAERRLAESELQAAIESRELAAIDHKRALEQLSLRSIASPFNGVVVDRLLNPGDLAESGSGRKPVLKIAQIDPLRVDVVLPASLFGQVKPGMKVSVAPVNVSARYAATVTLVDKLIDAGSTTFVARIELPNPEHKIAGGMRCTADLAGLAPPGAAPKSKL